MLWTVGAVTVSVRLVSPEPCAEEEALLRSSVALCEGEAKEENLGWCEWCEVLCAGVVGQRKSAL